MALMNCPECGASVSDLAATCPSCGLPIAPPRNDQRFPQSIAIGGVIALAAAFLPYAELGARSFKLADYPDVWILLLVAGLAAWRARSRRMGGTFAVGFLMLYVGFSRLSLLRETAVEAGFTGDRWAELAGWGLPLMIIAGAIWVIGSASSVWGWLKPPRMSREEPSS